MLHNVFAFDSFNDEVTKTVFEVFHRYGIFVGKASEKLGKVELAPKMDLPDLEILGTMWLSDSMLNETVLRFKRKPVNVISHPNAPPHWEELKQKVFARGAVFSEELFNFFHKVEGSGSLATCVASRRFMHLLSTSPLELFSYLVMFHFQTISF